MQIHHIRISNILGIDELEFQAGRFNEISGPNGAGKTSVLEAIKSITQTGHDATLLRKGADKGEVVLVLDDERTISKRVTASASKAEVTDELGKQVKSPSQVIKGLTDMLSVNPVDFLRAPKKDRVRVLLESMPLVADAEKLSEIVGRPVKVAADVHALHAIDSIYKEVYDDRTGTNRAVKEKDATINQLQAAVPELPAGVEGDEDSIRGEIEAARVAKDNELKRIDTKLEGIRTESQTKLDALKAEAQAKIDAIRTETQAAVDAEKAALADIESKAGKQRELTISRFSASVEPLNAAIEVIKTSRDALAKRKATLETIEQMQVDADELAEDAQRMTAALTALDQYKSDILNSLPIPGLEVKDGEVIRDGVPFDRLNTAQQVDIAVEIAKLRAGELAIACVDGLELLDPDAFEAFKQRAEESNLQLFITRVTGDEFEVKTS